MMCYSWMAFSYGYLLARRTATAASIAEPRSALGVDMNVTESDSRAVVQANAAYGARDRVTRTRDSCDRDVSAIRDLQGERLGALPDSSSVCGARNSQFSTPSELVCSDMVFGGDLINMAGRLVSETYMPDCAKVSGVQMSAKVPALLGTHKLGYWPSQRRRKSSRRSDVVVRIESACRDREEADVVDEGNLPARHSTPPRADYARLRRRPAEDIRTTPRCRMRPRGGPTSR